MRGKNSGMFGSGQTVDYSTRPKRGKTKRTLMLEALFDEIRDEEGDPLEDKEAAQAAYLRLLVRRSLTITDRNSAALAKEVLDRLIPTDKATMPTYEIEFAEDGSAADKIRDITNAVASGAIPPDVGNMMVNMVTAAVKVEETTELLERLAKLEEVLEEMSREE